MNIVNNQYKIVKELGGNPVSHFLVEDILNGNQRLEMVMFDRSILGGDVYRFLRRFFLHVYAFSGEILLRNVAFAPVKSIDEVKKDGSFLSYCIEYMDNMVPLMEWLPKVGDVQVLAEVFHALLRGLNYLLLRGLPHSSFLLENLYVMETEDGFHLKHKDLVTSEIEYMQSSNYRGEFAEGFFFSDENRMVDLHELAWMFLSILEGGTVSEQEDFSDRLTKLSRESEYRETLTFQQLVSFVRHLYDGTWDARVEHFYRIFVAFSETFSLSKVIEESDPLSLMAKHPIIVGRDEEVHRTLDIVKETSNSDKPGILFVQGVSGVGKTRFLRELDYLFNLENILTISSFHAGPDNSDAPLKDFFKVYSDFFVSYYSREKRREYMERLEQVKNYFTPEQDQELIHEGFRTLFYATNLISDLLQNQRIVFLIDNFEHVNTVVLDSILYFLTDSMLREKLLFIIGMDVSTVMNDPKFERFLHMTKSMCEVHTVDLLPLDMNRTMTMIKSILLTTKNDISLGQRIFMETSGSPRWISKLLREYVFNSYVYINTETGQWDFSEERLEEQKISASMETFDFRGVDALSAHEREALQILSCFRDSSSAEYIAKIIGIDSSEMVLCVHKLVALGIVEVYYERNARMVGIPNRSIASLIYERLSEEQRKTYHERILEQLDLTSDSDVLESLTQYRALGKQMEAKKVALKIAGSRRRNNPRSAITYYKMALEFIPEHRYEEAAQTRFVLSEIFMSFGDFQESLMILEGVATVYPNLTNVRLKEMYIYYRARLSMLIGDGQRLKECRKLIKELPLDERTNMAPAICMKIEADLRIIKGKTTQALQDYLRIIRKHEGDEEYDMILMDCYRWYAHYSKGRIRISERLSLYEKVVSYAERIGDTRTMLASLGNIANIYMLNYYDYDTAIEMFDRIISRARHGMHLALELFALNNASIAEEMRGNYVKALEILEVGLRRSEVVGRNNDKFYMIQTILRIHFKQGNFKKFELLLEEYRDFLEGEVSNPNYPIAFETMLDYYFALGDFERTSRYLADMLKFRPRIEEKKLKEWYGVYNLNEMLINGKYREHEVLSYIQYLYENPVDSDDQDSYTWLFRGIEMLLKKFGYSKLKNVLIFVQKMEKYVWTSRNKMYVYFFRAMTAEENDSDALEYLYFAQNTLKKYQKEPLGMTIHYETARRLVKYGANNEALIHLLDGILNVVRIMREVPDWSREHFFNQHQFAGVFRIFEKYHQTGVLSLQESEYLPADAEEIEYDLSVLVEDLLSRNNRTVELIITEKLRYRGYSRDLMEMLSGVTGDRKKNIDRILEYFATGIFATEAFIFLLDDVGEYQVFSSFYANVSLINPMVIAKYLTSKTVQIEDEPGFIKEYPYINALASFPIIENKRRRSDRSHGYIVFLSDSNVHLFDSLSQNYQLLGLQMLVSCIGSYELKQMVSIDKLTGTLTRKYLFDVLDIAFKKRKTGEICSIAMFDLDHFKRVNDSYGHQVGDLVLKSTAKLVTECLPEQCKVGRYGGEEFVILFPGWNASKALETGEMLLEKLEELRFQGHSDLHVTMSMGIKELGVEDTSVEEWIEKADRALYYAKDSGRNQCVVYRQDLAQHATEGDLLYGVVSNDEWKDGRIIVTLTELMLLKRQRHHLTQNLNLLLTRTIGLLSVREAGVVLLLSDGRERGFYKEFGKEDLFTDVHLKREFIHRMKNSDKSVNAVDWEDLPEREGQNIAFPVWNSQLVVRIVVSGVLKGLLYLRSPLKERIFDQKDLNLTEALSNVVGVYLSREDFYEYD